MESLSAVTVFANVNLLNRNCSSSFHYAVVTNSAAMQGKLFFTNLKSYKGVRIWSW